MNASELGSAMGLIWSFVPYKALEMAIKVGLFDIFEGRSSLSIDDIADDLDWPAETLYPLVEVLRRCDLLLDNNARYQLSPGAKKWFTKQGDQYLGDFVIRAAKLESAYAHFLQYSKHGKPVPLMLEETLAAFGGDKLVTNGFVQSMHAMSKEFSDELSEKVTISEYATLLDVGCGRGTLTASFLESNPGLSCDMFDLHGVTDMTKEYLRAKGLESRSKVYESDWNEWNWVRKYDVVVMSQVLHEMTKNEARRIIVKAATSIKSNGMLIIVSTAPIDNVDSLVAPIFSLNMLVELGNMNPTVRWIKEVAEGAGLVEWQVIALAGLRVAWIGKIV